MTSPRSLAAGILVAIVAAVLVTPDLTAQRPPTIAQFLSPPFPFELVAARKAERIAWLSYDEGKRNVFTAVPPALAPVRVTAFLEDDGTEISDLRIADNGSVVVFVRGTAPNSQGWVANPTSDPDGSEQAIWAARIVAAPPPARGAGPAPPRSATRVGGAWRLARGASPELAPDGSSVLFVRDGQIHRALVAQTAATPARDRGDEPFIRAWGTNSAPRWSPDGRRIAFVSNRVDHSFIGVYDVATRAVQWLAPSVDRDTSPTWSPDSTRVAFLRRPGLPFGQQAQVTGGAAATTGRGGRGTPPPAAVPAPPAAAQTPAAPQTPPPAAPAAGRGRQTTPAAAPSAAERARVGATPPPPQTGPGTPVPTTPPPAPPPAPPPDVPGLRRATFPGGYTLSVMVATVTNGQASEVWHTTAAERVFTNITTIRWAGSHIVFTVPNPADEWDRYYSLKVDGSATTPTLLTTTDGLIEDATSVALSPDGATMFYSTNAKDIDRRHIWSVPIAGGNPRQVTTGQGIETSPVVWSSGTRLAALTADAQRPQSVSVYPTTGGSHALVYPTLARTFPMFQHVVPEPVTLRAADGLEFSNQLFLPARIAAGERKPAIVFVHGGPARQMLLGYHYMHFYHVAYAVNQWLASQGYVVLSVNYRTGIGYGRTFRNAPNAGRQGSSEYQDVLAAGRYLQTRPDVDPDRIGIWGLSYGGILTAQALARNSDLFKAGVDLAGVHLWGSSLDPNDVAYRASAVSAISTWKSPVLLWHGDDDRNVAFTQTTGLVQLLRAHDVEFELIVYPDDTHETLLHSRWIETFGRVETFLKKHIADRKP